VAVRVVPTERPEGGAAFRQVTDLGGRDYLLSLDWVARWGEGPGEPGAWRLTLATTTGRVLTAGRALVPRTLLLARLADPDRPDGDLVVVHTGDGPPGLDDLGGAARLIYLDGEDLAAVRLARLAR
jgi:hypothetical protein